MKEGLADAGEVLPPFKKEPEALSSNDTFMVVVDSACLNAKHKPWVTARRAVL
jgi:hypothetical protein